jgi:lysophospholipase L1-like esterase
MRSTYQISAPILLLAWALLVSFSYGDQVPSSFAYAGESPPRSESRIFKAVADEPGALKLINASDPGFRYAGRIDHSEPAGPVIIWQGGRISIDFEGEKLALYFDDLNGQTFFDAQVDQARTVLAMRGEKRPYFALQSSLGPGWHRLTLVKRSEANAGTVRFKGILVAQNARVRATDLPPPPLTMEFIGDSITVGACNEDGAEDQWEDRLTHNNNLSYAAMTAAAFSADYRNTAVSGMGVVTGYVPIRATQIWDRLYPAPSSEPADLASWTPDVAFVLLGENDDSFTRSHGKPFPENFADEYLALVRQVRKGYPHARIVLLRGGMYGGSQSPFLRKAWESAVSRLEADDPKISHFAFSHWSKNHPRVADDRAMADELVGWLKVQEFMRKPANEKMEALKVQTKSDH